MTSTLRAALAEGVDDLARWSPLLDRINVFPVADGDTGRNLVATLEPLRRLELPTPDGAEALLLAARGNSGNIASQFFAPLLPVASLEDLPAAVAEGCRRARAAVDDPQEGTLLSLFDALRDALAAHPPRPGGDWADPVRERLADAVLRTRTQQERLARAGVVDAGALGGWIVLERWLGAVAPRGRDAPTLAQRFGEFLSLDPGWRAQAESGFCLDVVLRVAPGAAAGRSLPALGDSRVAAVSGDLMKVHVHSREPEAVRRQLADLGEILRFAVDDLADQGRSMEAERGRARVQLVTDAAGTFTADDAAEHGVVVLDSYVQLGGQSVPESQLTPGQLYAAMRAGERVTTAQASTAERHARFRAALAAGRPVLYLAVGSVFTGNVRAAEQFRDAEAAGDRFVVLDSGAASGRLGVAALATAGWVSRGATLAEARAVAERACALAEEWVFLDRLLYLARGGRLSRTAAFLGDGLRLKPVVSPRPTGAEKVGVVRRTRDQLPFLLARLAGLPAGLRPATLLLQYTDNEARLQQEIVPVLRERYPEAELRLRRISLTSGVHMGPGTWALACLPDLGGPAPAGGAGA